MIYPDTRIGLDTRKTLIREVFNSKKYLLDFLKFYHGSNIILKGINIIIF